jgi:hypothetical protein
MGSPASIYRSVRVSTQKPVPPRPGWKLPEVTLPDPGKPFVADLGAGIACRVPLALYADAQGTLPHPTAPSKGLPSSKPPGFTPTGKDRSTRLAAVALAWNVFQHFYPYFDVVNTDWPAELRRALSKAATDPDEDACLDTLRRLVAGLHDGHGNVALGSAAVQSFYPPLRWDWIEERLVVTRVAAEGAGGLKPGWAVLQVDGRPAADALAGQEQLISGATPQWKRYRALARMAEGARGSEITLDALSPTGEARSVRLRRTVDIVTLQAYQEPPRPARVEAIKPGIMYVDLGRVTDKEFGQALPRLAKATGVLLDLRGYPRVSPPSLGHLTDKPVLSPVARPGCPLSRSAQHGLCVFELEGRAEGAAFPREGRLPDGRPGHQLRRDVPGDRRALQVSRHRGGPDRRHQRQYQPLPAARRLPGYLDRDEGAQTRRLAAPRHWDPADRARPPHDPGRDSGAR